jgi:hypothetical protein
MERIPDPISHPVPQACLTEVVLGQPGVLRVAVRTDDLAVRPDRACEPVGRIPVSRPQLHYPASTDGSRDEFKEATGRPPHDWEPVLCGPRLHLDQNRFLVFRPRQFGEVAFHRVVHPPAHPRTLTGAQEQTALGEGERT